MPSDNSAEAAQPAVPNGRRRYRWVVLATGVLLLMLAGYYVNSLRVVRPEINTLRVNATALQTEIGDGNLAAAGETLGEIRESAQAVAGSLDGPLWGALTVLPWIGDDIGAARTVTSAAATVTAAAEPLEAVLPAFGSERLRASGGSIDTDAVQVVADALPGLSQAVSDADDALASIDASGLQTSLGDGVTQVRDAVRSAREPLERARRSAGVVPALIGSKGPRTYFVILQQSAEARGTGGLLGAYAVVSLDKGKLSLTEAASSAGLIGSRIPTGVSSAELEELWGKDLTEWAGLNLSPHFPWTGQLVQAGWAARPNTEPLDGVLAIDAHTVAALLAGTGPITVQGITISSENAVPFLSRDIYAAFPDYRDLDAFTVRLVKAVFGKVSAGQVDVPALVTALKQPYAERRLLMWSADDKEQGALETLTLGGALPSTPGPFVMPAINNGAGNKLDAYLKVKTTYEPGLCAQNVRVGRAILQLTNTAPTSGLPWYVLGLGGPGAPRDNKVLVDLYGPVGSDSPMALLDGEEAPILVRGTDRGHSVFRVAVTVNPGQTRTLEYTIIDPVQSGEAPLRAIAQPMVMPMEMIVGKLPTCS